jgi:hypothetical protein
LAAVACVLSTAVLAACGGPSKQAHPAASPTPVAVHASTGWLHQAPGKAAGEQVAQELVDAAVLPPGSQRVSTSPIPVLDKPATTIADDNFLDRNSWWKVNLPTSDVLSYLRAHPIKGLVLTVTGGGVSGPNQPTVYELGFEPAHPSAGNPTLQFAVVRAGVGASWFRADGQTIWYPARPAGEAAPATGRVVMSITSGPTRTVTAPAVVSRLAREFNSLLRTTPGTSSGVSCSPNERSLSISFTKPAEPSPTITASRSGCFPAWAVRGPGGDLPALEDGGDLLTDALRLLGLPSNALYALPTTASPSASG